MSGWQPRCHSEPPPLPAFFPRKPPRLLPFLTPASPSFFPPFFPAFLPTLQVSSDETQRLIKMEEVLHGRVIGQEEAVTAISRAIRRARVGLKNPNRPIASFIFSGGWVGGWVRGPGGTSSQG